MNQFLHSADYALWIAIILLQWSLFALAIRQKIQRRLPFYVAFIGFVSLQSPALFGISKMLSYNAYVWSFYFGMTAETALLVFVLIDIFKAAFAPLESLPAKTVPILAAVSAFTLVIIVALSIVLPAGSVNHLFAFCRTYHRAAELVVCICLWAIVLYARSLGIAWRDQMIGIASGFLFYLTVQALTTSAIAMTTNAAAVTWMSRAGIVAYMASLVIWIRAIVCSATSHAGVGTWKAQRYEPGRG